MTTATFTIRETAWAGRAAFATNTFPAGTEVLLSDLPSTSVVWRLFRKEVCAWCFAYDRGRRWKIAHSAGVYFCSKACREAWEDDLGLIGVQAWSVAHEWATRVGAPVEEEAIGSAPSAADVEKGWAEAERDAQLISSSNSSMARKRAKTLRPSSDTLFHLLSGVLTAHGHPDRYARMLSLERAPEAEAYRNARHLRESLEVYKLLLALDGLPAEVRACVTVETMRAVADRDPRNAFGLWDDDGSEMVGYGLWPSASVFNHSCAPNVLKERVGRRWRFWTARDVASGEQLTISYLGQGELGEMNVEERRAALMKTWRFRCRCERCEAEAGLA